MPSSALPLVMLPGLLCDRIVWAEQCAAFASERECIVPDYGGLDSLGAMAELVLAGVPPGRFALAGHSMGGRVALEVFRRAPLRVDRLALLDTGFQPLPAGDEAEKERRGRMALVGTARRQGMRAMGRLWARGMVHPSRLGTPVFDAVLDMIDRSTPDIFAAQQKALLERPDATPLLGAIDCPALVLCGRQDSWSPLAKHEEMAAQIAGAELVVIEDAGHMSTMERPGAVNDAFRAWLAR